MRLVCLSISQPIFLRSYSSHTDEVPVFLLDDECVPVPPAEYVDGTILYPDGE